LDTFANGSEKITLLATKDETLERINVRESSQN
jgi:hypothetical protein